MELGWWGNVEAQKNCEYYDRNFLHTSKCRTCPKDFKIMLVSIQAPVVVGVRST